MFFEHGGPDAQGIASHDFSTNANACGPCPWAAQQLAEADYRHYPDPQYHALRHTLAAWHGVAPHRIVLAASASEWIHRISAYAARSGLRHAVLPAHHYGDYAHAARTWGLQQVSANPGQPWPHPALHWTCEPSSPLGLSDASLPDWLAKPAPAGSLRMLDCAYAPLRLQEGAPPLADDVWQLWTPNKALGLTGVRAAYVIAPADAASNPHTAACLAGVHGLAPSWPIGAAGVALLQAWVQPQVQAWLAESLAQLRNWKAAQLAACASLGWQIAPGSLANFFCAQLPLSGRTLLPALRQHGIKLRDATSFGLPGWVRLGVLPPPSQAALVQAWQAIQKTSGA